MRHARTHRRTPGTRAAAIGAAAALIVGMVSTPAGAARTTYAGYATGSAVHVDAGTASQGRLLNVDAGIVDAAVDESGLKKRLSIYERPVVPKADASLHARARSSVLDVGVLLDPPESPAQLQPFAVVSEAPPGEEKDDALLDQDIHPVVSVSLAEREADTNWFDNSCVLGEPISEGRQSLASLELLDSAENFDQPLVTLVADDPTRAVTTIQAREQIFLTGPGRGGLQSVTTATIAPVTLFEGTANEFTIEFGGPAALSASADGTPGGADVIFRAPLVTVVQDGSRSTVAPSEPTTITVPTTGQPLAEVRIGTVDPLPGPAGVNDGTAMQNGTAAAAVVNVVEVTLFDVDDPRLTGATVAIGHMEASSMVPAGGIECGLPVTKDANPNSVSVDDLFTTTITVSNPYPCTLTDVRIVDELRTRGQGSFEMVKTKPDADAAPSGASLTSGRVVWDDIGDIASGAEKRVKLTMRAASVGRILDTATASGVLVGCATAFPGSDAEDVSVLGRADASVDGVGALDVDVSAVLGVRLPRTGIGSLALLGGSMLGTSWLMAGMLVRRRRRTG